MKIKRFLLAAVLAVLALMILTSCGGEEEEGDVPSGKAKTLNVYNWGEYISDGSLDSYDTIAEFEKWYEEKYGEKVKVNYTTFATNEDMYAKIKSGAGSYDVIIPSDYMIQKMINDPDGNLLQPLKKAEIPNLENLDDAFCNLYYDPDGLYTAAYSYGKVGIIYNTTMVDEEDVADESWGLLWNPKYKGKILQFNNERDGFATAQFYLGLDINSKDENVWRQALDKLLEQKPILQGYVSDEIFNKMQNGSAAIGTYYAGDYLTMAEENEYLAFYYPKEGTNVFVDAMCIPTCAKEPVIASRFINFMLSEEAAVANAEYIGYASPNKLVRENAEYKEYFGEEAMDILYKDTEDTYAYDPHYFSFDPDTQRLVTSLWEELKTESAIEPWIHVVSIVIVVGVTGLIVYTAVVDKKRSAHYRKKQAKSN